jgi:hypothetical protein
MAKDTNKRRITFDFQIGPGIREDVLYRKLMQQPRTERYNILHQAMTFHFSSDPEIIETLNRTQLVDLIFALKLRLYWLEDAESHLKSNSYISAATKVNRMNVFEEHLDLESKDMDTENKDMPESYPDLVDAIESLI